MEGSGVYAERFVADFNRCDLADRAKLLARDCWGYKCKEINLLTHHPGGFVGDCGGSRFSLVPLVGVLAGEIQVSCCASFVVRRRGKMWATETSG